jgi:hypothetical protein
LSLLDQFFGFSVFPTFLLPCEFADVLVADYQERRCIRNGSSHFATGAGGKVGSITPRH